MGIPLLAHPKHTYSKIGGLTDSESEYTSDPEEQLDDLIQYSKQVESNSAKNLKPDHDSLPNLNIYAMPQGRTLHLRKAQDPNASGSQPADLPYQQSTPLDLSSGKQDQEIQDLCHEILMVHIAEEPEGDPIERLNLDDYNSNDFDLYLSDNTETTPPTITEAQAATNEDLPAPPPPPPAVIVTVQLDKQHPAEDLYERRRQLNQKRAFSR